MEHLRNKLCTMWLASCPKNMVKQHLEKAPYFIHEDLQLQPTG